MNFHVHQNWSNYVPTTANCDWLIYDRHVPVIFSIFPPFRNFTSQHPDIYVGYLPGPLPPHIDLQRWLSEINNDTRKDANQSNKMKTYRLFKTIDNYKCEDYLHQVTNMRHWIALTKLQLSNHKLAIETGRYSRPFNKKPEERICPICKIEMEDEYHFLNICPHSLPGKKMFVTWLFGKRIWNKNKQNVA